MLGFVLGSGLRRSGPYENKTETTEDRLVLERRGEQRSAPPRPSDPEPNLLIQKGRGNGKRDQAEIEPESPTGWSVDFPMHSGEKKKDASSPYGRGGGPQE